MKKNHFTQIVVYFWIGFQTTDGNKITYFYMDYTYYIYFKNEYKKLKMIEFWNKTWENSFLLNEKTSLPKNLILLEHEIEKLL